MFQKILLLAALSTAGLMLTADNADARVRVYAGPRGVAVRTGGYYGPARYRAIGYGVGYGGYGYSAYGYPTYVYSNPSPAYFAPTYSYPAYGYAYPSYGYGRYYGGRSLVVGPNRYYYRGPVVRFGGWH